MPCLLDVLILRARFRVTGSPIGQLGQSWKDGELRPGVKPTRQGEASKDGCQESRVL